MSSRRGSRSSADPRRGGESREAGRRRAADAKTRHGGRGAAVHGGLQRGLGQQLGLRPDHRRRGRARPRLQAGPGRGPKDDRRAGRRRWWSAPDLPTSIKRRCRRGSASLPFARAARAAAAATGCAGVAPSATASAPGRQCCRGERHVETMTSCSRCRALAALAPPAHIEVVARDQAAGSWRRTPCRGVICRLRPRAASRADWKPERLPSQIPSLPPSRFPSLTVTQRRCPNSFFGVTD